MHNREGGDPTRFSAEFQDYENKISEMERNTKNFSALTATIGPDDIEKVVSNLTGIPVARLDTTEKGRIIDLYDRLRKRVVGQDQAIMAVADAVLKSRTGLGRSDQPVGSLLFLGPTGVGKTEVAKALCEQLFDNEKDIVRFDMSEFIHSQSVFRLIGAPPG